MTKKISEGSLKKQVESGMTTVTTAQKISMVIIVIGLGALLLGISIGGLFF